MGQQNVLVMSSKGYLITSHTRRLSVSFVRLGTLFRWAQREANKATAALPKISMEPDRGPLSKKVVFKAPLSGSMRIGGRVIRTPMGTLRLIFAQLGIEDSFIGTPLHLQMVLRSGFLCLFVFSLV